MPLALHMVLCQNPAANLLRSKGRGMGRIILSGSAKGWLRRAPRLSKLFPPQQHEGLWEAPGNTPVP